MGFALAEEAAFRGAEVTLVSGPSFLEIHQRNITRVDVTTAGEMLEACLEQFPHNDLCLMAAAVADFRPAHPSPSKLKKDKPLNYIELEPTVDILQKLGQIKQQGQVLVGFALETDDEMDHAKRKLKNKNLDFIVLNSLNDQGAGFGLTTNRISIIESSGSVAEYELKAKDQVACDILDRVTGRGFIKETTL
jgi:phosphopantothenoylcysteine decarboxylase/phosphopantothenate--cysteine ligase